MQDPNNMIHCVVYCRYKVSCTHVLRKSEQFLLHYSSNKPSESHEWTRKGPGIAYDKWNIFMVICDTNILHASYFTNFEYISSYYYRVCFILIRRNLAPIIYGQQVIISFCFSDLSHNSITTIVFTTFQPMNSLKYL